MVKFGSSSDAPDAETKSMICPCVALSASSSVDCRNQLKVFHESGVAHT